MSGLTDDQLKAITDAELRQSIGYYGGKLSEMRRKAEYYFLGMAKGDLAPPEIEGRSSVVDTTVRNTILWMLPNLIKAFCSGDKVVEFTPTNPDDEEKAGLATEYINYVFYKQNPGYQIVNTWFMDALLQKVGVLKVWWDDRQEQSREEYRGQTDVELAMLLDDDEVEPIEHSMYPDEEASEQKNQALQQAQQQLQSAMQAAQQGDQQAAQAIPQIQQQLQMLTEQPVPNLHDVTFKRTKKSGKVAIENVPPEEFMISRKAKSLTDTPFVAHRVMRTVSDLTAMGYKNVDQIRSDENGQTMSMEHVERVSYDDDAPYLNQDTVNGDPSQRIVWLTECYLRADVDGDGIAEWRKVVRAGNEILENVECDGPPFVSITPIPLPYRFHGLSIADLGMEPQRIQTSLLRAQLDNLYLQVNGRYFAVEGQVDLDDLLTSRPGGVVRVKTPNAVGRLDQSAADSGHAMEMMNWFQSFAEDSTGWTRQSQGFSPDVMNQTATGMNIITNKADMRNELIARQFAETGFTDLFKLILKLVCQYQDKSKMVSISGKWTNIDPREWRNQFDLTINVGLGTGNKDQQVQHLTMLEQAQGRGLSLGITKPKNIYNTNKKLAEALGFKNSDAYFTDPDAPPDPYAPPPPPPAPDPHIIKAQQDDQQHQRELAMKAQMADADRQHAAQLAQVQAQMQAEVDNNRQRAEAAQKQLQLQQEADLARMKAEIASRHEMERITLERWKAQLASDTQIAIAQIQAAKGSMPMQDQANLIDDRAGPDESTGEVNGLEPENV